LYASAVTPYSHLYSSTLTTVQPYVEFAATPLPNLTITPGVKYTNVVRGLDAPMNKAPLLPAKFNQTFDAVLPAIDAHYKIQPNWVAYAQIAEGFLAPPLNVLFTPTPSSIKPQSTTNYQIGTTFQHDRLNLAADMYYIDFQNYIATIPQDGGANLYVNNGSAVFKGIELEATAQITRGVAFYANGTLNSATYSTGLPVALSPRQTAAAGPIVDRDGLTASLLWKFVGPQLGSDGTSPSVHASYPIKSYNNVDLAVGYKLELPGQTQREVNVRLNVLNVFDDRNLTAVAGMSGSTPLYWTNPGRGALFSVSAGL
jgi:iron complex outermembrane receptor protein